MHGLTSTVCHVTHVEEENFRVGVFSYNNLDLWANSLRVGVATQCKPWQVHTGTAGAGYGITDYHNNDMGELPPFHLDSPGQAILQ